MFDLDDPSMLPIFPALLILTILTISSFDLFDHFDDLDNETHICLLNHIKPCWLTSLTMFMLNISCILTLFTQLPIVDY